jgi:hypothetical protein
LAANKRSLARVYAWLNIAASVIAGFIAWGNAESADDRRFILERLINQNLISEEKYLR